MPRRWRTGDRPNRRLRAGGEELHLGIPRYAGNVLFGPWAITDLSAPQGFGFNTTGLTAPDLSHLASPWTANPKAAPRAWALVQEMVTYWLGLGPGASVADLDVDPGTNTVGDKMLAMMNATYAEGNTRDPAKLKPFIAQGRKMILYHGASDPSIPASQSIAFYRELAEQQQGDEHTQDNVRLFLVPGMHHCSGGPAPDRFDTLSAIEAWVEHGHAPDAIQASTRPDSAVQHRLPLCPWHRSRRAIAARGRSPIPRTGAARRGVPGSVPPGQNGTLDGHGPRDTGDGEFRRASGAPSPHIRWAYPYHRSPFSADRKPGLHPAALYT